MNNLFRKALVETCGIEKPREPFKIFVDDVDHKNSTFSFSYYIIGSAKYYEDGPLHKLLTSAGIRSYESKKHLWNLGDWYRVNCGEMFYFDNIPFDKVKVDGHIRLIKSKDEIDFKNKDLEDPYKLHEILSEDLPKMSVMNSKFMEDCLLRALLGKWNSIQEGEARARQRDLDDARAEAIDTDFRLRQARLQKSCDYARSMGRYAGDEYWSKVSYSKEHHDKLKELTSW